MRLWAIRLLGQRSESKDEGRTKLLGRSAVDYDAVVAPTGRHGFREEVASMSRASREAFRL
jgi:hypothetical protein